jgi:hypothetical protein
MSTLPATEVESIGEMARDAIEPAMRLLDMAVGSQDEDATQEAAKVLVALYRIKVTTGLFDSKEGGSR